MDQEVGLNLGLSFDLQDRVDCFHFKAFSERVENNNSYLCPGARIIYTAAYRMGPASVWVSISLPHKNGRVRRLVPTDRRRYLGTSSMKGESPQAGSLPHPRNLVLLLVPSGCSGEKTGMRKGAFICRHLVRYS